MEGFRIGFGMGIGTAVLIVLLIGESPATYRQGMVDCRLNPERCEELYQAHLAEEKARELNAQASRLRRQE